MLIGRRGEASGGLLDKAVEEYSSHLADEYTFVDQWNELVNRTRIIEGLRSGERIFSKISSEARPMSSSTAPGPQS